MPVQGVESPYPESTARVISEFCDARSNFSLAEAAQHDRTIESLEELRFVTANRATDDIISIHARSMKPRACRRKFRILSAVQSEGVACKSVGSFFDGFVNSGRQHQQKSKSINARVQSLNLQPDRYERRTLSGKSSKISVSRSRSFTLVRVCSRGFCRITGGIENRRKPPTCLDRTIGAGLLMSVVRGRPEVTGRGSNRRD